MTKTKLLPSRGQCTSDAAMDVCLCIRLCNGDNLYKQAILMQYVPMGMTADWSHDGYISFHMRVSLPYRLQQGTVLPPQHKCLTKSSP